MEQINIFEALYGQYKIPKNKAIKLIELFAGIGAQAKALENLGVDFEKYRIVEFDPKAVESYNAIHHTDFTPMDITKVHAQDLAIRERELSPAMTTRSDTLGVAVEQENNLAIRKLTPCECLRLMGFSNEDYKAVRFQSDACLYKQAGNSIVVNVLMAIFKQLL